MAANLASANIALDRVWTQRTLESQLYQENPFLDRLDKKTKYTVGETARVPLHTGRNGGFTNLPAGGGNLNTAGNQGLQKAEFNYTNAHQQIAVQGEVIDGTGGSKAIIDAADLEITGALADMRRQLSRQAVSNGDALICQCRTSNTNNVDLELVSGAQAITRGWLFVGQPVDVGTTSAETAIVDNSLITAIDETNVAFTVAAGNQAGEGTTHYVSQANGRSGATSYEMNGMQNVYSATATLGGLSVATEPSWKATVNSASQALTISLLLQAQQQIVQKRGKKPNFLYTGLKQQRKFYEQLQQQVRQQSDKALTAGSDDTTTWDGTEIWADPDVQDTHLYMGHFDHLFLVAMDKPYWQNKITGGNILVWIQGTDGYGGKLTYRVNLGANRRNDGYAFTALT